MPQVLCAMKALIERDGRFLVVKQQFSGGDYWDLPGGRVEHGETPLETLHREVKEETGLEIEVQKPAGVWWFFRQDGNQVVCMTFFCQVKSGRVTINQNPADENISGFRWVTKKEFLQLPVADQSLHKLVEGFL